MGQAYGVSTPAQYAVDVYGHRSGQLVWKNCPDVAHCSIMALSMAPSRPVQPSGKRPKQLDKSPQSYPVISFC